MITKKLTLTTILLIIAFFIVGWIITRPIIEMLVDYYTLLTKNSQIVSTSMSEEFRIHLFSSISFGLLPVFCFLTAILLIKTKNKEISLRDYIIYLVYIIAGFIIGGLIKIFLFAKMVKTLDNQDFPQLINTFPMRLVKFHDWGIIISIIASLLIYILTKKVKLRN
jgi:hypothetical protein